MRVDKELLRKEFGKEWKDEGMIKYCVGSVASMGVLPDGGIVTVQKQKIEKDFCFGESGYDFDEAVQKANHARTSEEYFKKENMRYFNEWFEVIEEAKKDGEYRVLISPNRYYDQDKDCRLVGVSYERFGSRRFTGVREASKEELAVIEKIFKEAAESHEKKVNAYLKKYGLSKVHSWTYWRDA